MLLDRDRAAWRCGGGVVSIYWFWPPALTSFVTLTRAREGQAVVCPLLRGRSPTRSVAPKPLRGLGRASLRLPCGAWVPKNLARRSFGLLVSAARCCSTGSGRLRCGGGVV